jgi:hypothetical protein
VYRSKGCLAQNILHLQSGRANLLAWQSGYPSLGASNVPKYKEQNTIESGAALQLFRRVGWPYLAFGQQHREWASNGPQAEPRIANATDPHDKLFVG